MIAEAISSRTRAIAGKKRVHMASMRKTPISLAQAAMRRASSPLRAIGFSQITCLPARMHMIACSQWNGCGVAM